MTRRVLVRDLIPVPPAVPSAECPTTSARSGPAGVGVRSSWPGSRYRSGLVGVGRDAVREATRAMAAGTAVGSALHRARWVSSPSASWRARVAAQRRGAGLGGGAGAVGAWWVTRSRGSGSTTSGRSGPAASALRVARRARGSSLSWAGGVAVAALALWAAPGAAHGWGRGGYVGRVGGCGVGGPGAPQPGGGGMVGRRLPLRPTPRRAPRTPGRRGRRRRAGACRWRRPGGGWRPRRRGCRVGWGR